MQSYTLKEQKDYMKLLTSLPSLNEQLEMLVYREVRCVQSNQHMHVNQNITPINLKALDLSDQLESLEREILSQLGSVNLTIAQTAPITTVIKALKDNAKEIILLASASISYEQLKNIRDKVLADTNPKFLKTFGLCPNCGRPLRYESTNECVTCQSCRSVTNNNEVLNNTRKELSKLTYVGNSKQASEFMHRVLNKNIPAGTLRRLRSTGRIHTSGQGMEVIWNISEILNKTRQKNY
ncbi:hypothetical protein HXT27_06025 [Gardnerella sp. DNF00502]|uniref:hypothetical protein n=1 Tax=Gardnerella sp. DNF00502 TaxID=2749049 RepID=UPI003BB09C39